MPLEGEVGAITYFVGDTTNKTNNNIKIFITIGICIPFSWVELTIILSIVLKHSTIDIGINDSSIVMHGAVSVSTISLC